MEEKAMSHAELSQMIDVDNVSKETKYNSTS